MGARIETDMRRDAFDHLQKLSDSYFANTKVGQIMGRITNDLFDVTEFAHHCPEEFFIAGLKGVISFIILRGHERMAHAHCVCGGARYGRSAARAFNHYDERACLLEAAPPASAN